MNQEPVITLRIGRRTLVAAGAILIFLVAFAVFPDLFHAQKTQENFKDKLDVAGTDGNVAVATSSDGKYVYVAGPEGVIVSGDYGKTGSWTQTARLK